MIVGTVFEVAKLPLMRWFLATQPMAQATGNISARELTHHLCVHYKATRLMKLKPHQVMVERKGSLVLDGRRIEVDGAYLGGECQGKRGRSSEAKVSFLVAVQTADDGRPVLVRMNRIAFTKDAIEDWTNRTLDASARVISGSTSFRHHVANYQAVIVGSGRQSVMTHPEFRRINTVLFDLKTTISGTYHHLNFA